MNKKLLITFASFIGVISIFMPWFSFMGYSLNAVSEEFSDGYFLGLLFAVILLISLFQPLQEKLGKKKDNITIIVAVIILIFSIAEIITNKEMLDYGASLGIGIYASILSSGFIAIYTIYLKKSSDSNSELKFDKEKMMDITQKGVGVAKAITKVAGKATKSAIGEVKKELQEKESQKKKDDGDTLQKSVDNEEK